MDEAPFLVLQISSVVVELENEVCNRRKANNT